jgi:hypothetical protein
MAGDIRRQYLYGESLTGAKATRMLHDGRHKLLWYAAGNRFQLFDLQDDPGELNDLSAEPGRQALRRKLETALVAQLYGDDLAWVQDGRLVGMTAPELEMKRNRDLSGQRGLHFPPLALTDPSQVVGAG